MKDWVRRHNDAVESELHTPHLVSGVQSLRLKFCFDAFRVRGRPDFSESESIGSPEPTKINLNSLFSSKSSANLCSPLGTFSFALAWVAVSKDCLVNASAVVAGSIAKSSFVAMVTDGGATTSVIEVVAKAYNCRSIEVANIGAVANTCDLTLVARDLAAES
ncbi:unnamed protein product [Linum trigynum]|uniref:Uncharacterized protein n=1 Tax=Linum trigynum TaxID=586398 RepID=A0AAV2DBI2_9ROSI